MKLIRIVLYAPLFLLNLQPLSGQEALVPSGYTGSSGNGSLSFTLGQVLYETVASENGTASPGVQQAYEIFIVDGIRTDFINLKVKAFPNPVTDFLVLEIGEFSPGTFSFRLIDQQGRILRQEDVRQSPYELEVGGFPSATYFLQVFTGEDQIKTFQIVKN